MGQTTAAGQVLEWVCLDVGETLVDETRVWSVWADVLGVPPFTLQAVLGGVIARGADHAEVFPLVGVPDWRSRMGEANAAYGGFRADDLYPDAIPTLEALRAAGFRVAIVANQPASRTEELRALGVEAEVMAMSDALGVGKPDPAFFARALALMGDPDPATVAYVGDRVDNDVLPASAAGLRAVWLRRGPWGLLQTAPSDAAWMVVGSLDELVARLVAMV